VNAGEREEDKGPRDFPGDHDGVRKEDEEAGEEVGDPGREREPERGPQDDPRLLPDLIEEQVGCDSQAQVHQPPKAWNQAHSENCPDEHERVGPQPRLEPQQEAKGFVDEVRQDRSKEDEAIVDGQACFPREEPREAETDPQVAQEVHLPGGFLNGDLTIPRQESPLRTPRVCHDLGSR